MVQVYSFGTNVPCILLIKYYFVRGFISFFCFKSYYFNLGLFSESKMSGSVAVVNDQNRYIFGITGTVKEIIYPSKAILGFKYNGKEEKAILLVHKFLIDGCNVDEQKLMSDLLKIGDVLEFDGHIYDKGGQGGGKDRCNYYAMRAWKASQSKLVAKQQMLTNKAARPPVIVGTGFISEVFPRKFIIHTYSKFICSAVFTVSVLMFISLFSFRSPF